MPTDIPNKMARGVSNKVGGHFKRCVVYLRKGPKVYLIEWPVMFTLSETQSEKLVHQTF